jgi:Mg2+/Co2+ transporter CorB
LPVYHDNIDQIVGILHLRHLANLSPTKFDRASILGLMTDPYFVPESTPLSMQLVQFQRRHQRIAIIVDEYGDVQGIVTLEDILEEIVGEFTTDPTDSESVVVKDIAGSFLVDAGANIRDLNRTQGWDLPTDGPKTLNGLIVELLEAIPEPTECLKINGYPIEIVESDENRIRSVRIGKRLEPEISAD